MIGSIGAYSGINNINAYQKMSSATNNKESSNSQLNAIVAGKYKPVDKIKPLGSATTTFLNDYSKDMQSLSKSSDNVSSASQDVLNSMKDQEKPSQETIDKLSENVNTMLNDYNKSLKLLNNNASRGTGVTRHLSAMLTTPLSSKTMSSIGINIAKDGQMSLDKDVFKKAVAENPKMTAELIGGDFGISSGMQNDAENALRASSNSLINNDIKLKQIEQLKDPSNFFSTYSKTGAFNMMNYYNVGYLMNLTA